MLVRSANQRSLLAVEVPEPSCQLRALLLLNPGSKVRRCSYDKGAASIGFQKATLGSQCHPIDGVILPEGGTTCSQIARGVAHTCRPRQMKRRRVDIRVHLSQQPQTNIRIRLVARVAMPLGEDRLRRLTRNG